tara:strand:+ start:369 stop:512 length:144 start_codon:yes stop_codon:yes gene_type:complete
MVGALSVPIVGALVVELKETGRQQLAPIRQEISGLLAILSVKATINR